MGVSEGARGDGGDAVWEGSACRSAGAQSLLGARCYNQVVPTELRVREIEPWHGSYHGGATRRYAGKTPAVPGRTGRPKGLKWGAGRKGVRVWS
jgi:hypothetical protein